MRLAALLADTSTEDLERIAHEHARAEDHLNRPALLDTIEGVLRSYRFLQDFLFNRQPPAFSIVSLLLDAEDFSLPIADFRDWVLMETNRIADAIAAGELLGRDDQLRVYRRVLYQARSNDMMIDPSEAAILGVLRAELGIAQVEHFLIEHHSDLREFWKQDGAFARELHALRSAGLVFVRDGRTLLPEDLVPVVRQVLGLDMSRDAMRRLLGHLSSSDLHDALVAISAPSSGSKDQRLERLVEHRVQPRSVLRGVGLDTLRSICRDTGAPVSGSKEELVQRVVAHFAAGRDLANAFEEEPPPPPKQERALPEARFVEFFSALRGHELTSMLSDLGLRRFGTKELLVRLLWDSHRSESTLLGILSSHELEAINKRFDLRSGGSKTERIERLVAYAAAGGGSPNE